MAYEPNEVTRRILEGATTEELRALLRDVGETKEELRQALAEAEARERAEAPQEDEGPKGA